MYNKLPAPIPIVPTPPTPPTKKTPDQTEPERDTRCDPERQFTCPNGECIALDERCNGRLDCYDGADESNCPVKCKVYKCTGEEKCYDYAEKCDGKYDCQDGSDEQSCRKYWDRKRRRSGVPPPETNRDGGFRITSNTFTNKQQAPTTKHNNKYTRVCVCVSVVS